MLICSKSDKRLGHTPKALSVPLIEVLLQQSLRQLKLSKTLHQQVKILSW